MKRDGYNLPVVSDPCWNSSIGHKRVNKMQPEKSVVGVVRMEVGWD